MVATITQFSQEKLICAALDRLDKNFQWKTWTIYFAIPFSINFHYLNDVFIWIKIQSTVLMAIFINNSLPEFIEIVNTSDSNFAPSETESFVHVFLKLAMNPKFIF